MNLFFLGVDPGKSGAIAGLDAYGTIILLQDYPGSEIELAMLFNRTVKPLLDKEIEEGRVHGAVEKVSAMPKQGVKSMFTFGDNYGQWRMGLSMIGVPFDLVTPQTWMKGVVAKKSGDKKPSFSAALRKFPTAQLHGPKGGKKDGRADALLIADWCRRQYVDHPLQGEVKPRRKRTC